MCDSWDPRGTGGKGGRRGSNDEGSEDQEPDPRDRSSGGGGGGCGGSILSPSGDRKWVCKACTYENWPRAVKCAICCHPKNYNIFVDPHRPRDIYEVGLPGLLSHARTPAPFFLFDGSRDALALRAAYS